MRAMNNITLMIGLATSLVASTVRAADPKVDTLIAQLKVPDKQEQAIDGLLALGSPGVEAAVKLAAAGLRTGPFGYDGRTDGLTLGMAVLLKASPDQRRDLVIPALKTALEKSTALNERLNLFQTLALLDPAARNVHELPGQTAIERKPTANAWDFALSPGGCFVDVFYSLARIAPDATYASKIAEAIRTNESGNTHYLGMLMNNIGGAAAVPETQKLLDAPDAYVRWAGAEVLTMLGDKSKPALPKLEAMLADGKEDVLVRVSAARAIARIRNVDPFTLYGQIDNVDDAVIRGTREKSAAWRKHIMERKGAAFIVPKDAGKQEDVFNATYALMTGQHVAEADQYLRDACAGWLKGKAPYATNPLHVIVPLVLFHDGSGHSKVRLRPETEAQMKEAVFAVSDARIGWNQKYTHDSKSILATIRSVEDDPSLALGLNGNGYYIPYAANYLAVSLLKEDPQYRDRKFAAGDTVTDRYEALDRYFRTAYRNWIKSGLTHELGCPGYDAYTTGVHFLMADLAADPEVRTLANMYCDIWMVERAQSSISGFRTGAKSRPKGSEYGHRFQPIEALLYGERGGEFAFPSAFLGYQPPDAAILLHRLGAKERRYDMWTRFIGDAGALSFRPGTPAFVYAYRTPEYLIGCWQIDPNRPIPRWLIPHGKGVWFRDLEAIALPGFESGGQWCVQNKDVMIVQRYSGTWFGRPHLEFTAGLKTLERDGWVFATNGRAYAAIRMVVGGYVWEHNPSTFTRLWANDTWTPIIIQTGMAEDYASYEDFQEKILKAPLKLEFTPDKGQYDGKKLSKVTYAGPNAETITFVPDTQHYPTEQQYTPPVEPYILPKVGDWTLDREAHTNYRSPFLTGERYRETVTVRYGEREWVYDLKNPGVNASKK